MSRSSEAACALATLLLIAGGAVAEPWPGPRYGYGREAKAEEIRGWDRTVRADDGRGLPPGQGSARDGERLYEERCAGCHGDFGEGAPHLPLAGGIGSLGTDSPLRTVGSLWPYAPGVFGYIHAAMPFGQAYSLTPDQTYAVTAYVLYLNDLVNLDAVIDAATLTAIEMPNRNGFTAPDPRPDVPAGEPCMANCRAGRPIEVLSRANDLNVTPDTSPPR